MQPFSGNMPLCDNGGPDNTTEPEWLSHHNKKHSFLIHLRALVSFWMVTQLLSCGDTFTLRQAAPENASEILQSCEGLIEIYNKDSVTLRLPTKDYKRQSEDNLRSLSSPFM